MRIVAGSLGGRVIRAPSGSATRPTSEKVREAVFSILGPPPQGAAVLDLFAGSGAMALEALSRGAARAVAVEQAAPVIAVLKRNAAELGVSERIEVVRRDVLAYLRAAASARFHWIFVDPPYRSDLGVRALEAISPAWLAPGSMVVLEHDRAHAPNPRHGSLLRVEERRYGDTFVSLFAPRPEAT